MTRKLLTDFNTRPYYDDFNVDKDFLRILFRPGTALQAREITQLQTIINEQIHRFGNHIFKDGSVVLDGSFNVDVNVKYIKLHEKQSADKKNDDNYEGAVDTYTYISKLENRVLTNESKTVRFLVRKSIENTSSEPNTIVGVYLSGGEEVLDTGNELLTTEFEMGLPTYTVRTAYTNGDTEHVNSGDSIKGNSSIASVNEGIFYISGFFHKVQPQTIVLDKYSNTPTYRIGLEVDESIVTSSDDPSLYDNAQGSSNYSSPGADRFKISLILKKNQLDSALGNLINNNASCEFYEFVRVRNGRKVDQIKNPQYSYLGEEMARRTYDANGDFVVKNFTLDIAESSDADKLSVILDPGKAYVKGNEIETISPITLTLDKGRDESKVFSENVGTFVGNYVYVDFVGELLSSTQFPDISSNEKIILVNNGFVPIGSCRIKQLNYDSKGYKLSFFDLSLSGDFKTKDIFSFVKDGKRIFNVSTESRLSGVTIISQQESAPLLYNLEKSSVSNVGKNMDPAGLFEYFKNEKIENVSATYSSSSQNTILNSLTTQNTISLPPNPNGPDYSNLTILSNFIVIGQNTGKVYQNIECLVTDHKSADIRISGNVTSDDDTFVVFVKVQIDNQSPRQKTLIKTIIDINSSDMNEIGKSVPLIDENGIGYYDIIRIVSIQEIGDNKPDIKERYELDNGQRDSFYDIGSIKLKSGYSVSDETNFKVTFEWFEHSGTGYFSKNSYDDFPYEDIPIYYSKNTGRSYSLTDVIDFRPTKNLDGNGEIIEGGSIPYGSESDYLQVDYEYYLPRIDKIILTKDKEFRVIKGTSSDNPKTPPDDLNAMSLYIITVPPYTYNNNDLKVVPIHNRRYTMRDIGILDRRIEELQSRSNLRLLQEKSKNVQIRGASGNDIFKNGILIDDFSGHSVGDINSPDYRCSIDFDTQELRPSFYSSSHKISFDETNSSNVTKKGPLILLDYEEVSHQVQPLASKSLNINPHKMAYWFGEIKLNPSSDMWFSQSLKPRVNINDSGENNAWENLSQSVDDGLENGFGTQWNDWETLWTGKENFISSEEIDPSSLVESNIVKLQSRETSNNLFDVVDRIGIVGSQLPNRIERDMLNKKIDTSVVPFMRENKVVFVSTNLKPNTVFYAYFDDYLMEGNDVTPCTKVDITDSSKKFIDGIYEGEIITCTTGSARVIKNSNDGTGSMYVEILDGEISGNIVGLESKIQASVSETTLQPELKSDKLGQLCGILNISSKDDKKFRTGQRLFRLIDNNSNELFGTESLAETSFYAQGLMDDPENYVVSTRLPLIKRSSICDELSISRDVFSRELNSINRCLDWKDPLSQTFIVDRSSNRNGIFLSSVDLYFKSKDTSLPVMIEIRPTVNGYPSTSTVLPFSEVVLTPSQVKVSEPTPETNNHTKFTFDSPVYLTPGEYAVVIKTNSDKYELWESSIGDSVLDSDGAENILNEKVTKQPLIGNLFTSHNSGVWEKINNESLMFRLNRCDFVDEDASLKLNVESPSTPQEFNLFKFNTSILKNFVNSVNPEFKYSIGSDVLLSFHENRNIELSSTKEISTDNVFTITSSFSSSDSCVSPVIDIERMSLITVRNIIDSVEYDTSDITIQNGGSGYQDGDILTFEDLNDSFKKAIFSIKTQNGVVTGFEKISSSKNMIYSLKDFNVSSAGGQGLQLVIDQETSPKGSVADSVYISKRVNLKYPYESKDIRVYLDLYKPSGTDVFVYYKVASTNDSVSFDDRNWYLMKQITPEYVVSQYKNDYREYVFGPDTNGGGVDLIKNEDLVNFNIYAIKIVFSSNNKSKVPKARNLRAIALQEPAGV